MRPPLPNLVRKAWPAAPYPGDPLLSDCWCEECEYSVRNLRGKAWREITRDDINGENSRLNDRAFLYYLPALILLSLSDPEDVSLSNLILERFVAIEMDPPTPDQQEGYERVRKLSSTLSGEQRRVLAWYFDGIDEQGWQFPGFTNAAKRCVLDGLVEPVSYSDVIAWARNREQEDGRKGK